MIVAGERRWRAYQLAKIEKVPAVVKDVGDKEILLESLLENINRENLKWSEQENAIWDLWKSGAFRDYEELGRKLGKKVKDQAGFVERQIAAKQIRDKYKAPESVSTQILTEVARIPDEQTRRLVIQRVVSEKLGVHDMRDFIQTISKAPESLRKAVIEKRITRDEMVAYFRTYYAPNNCVLLLVGDFEPANAKSKLAQYFASIPRQTPPAAPVDSEPEQIGEKRVDVRYPSETVSIDVGYKAPSVASDDIWTLDILSNILSGGESSRLHQALVYEQQIALSAGASFRAGLEPGLFELYAEMKPGHTAEEGEKSLYAEIQRLASDGPSERELQKARNQAEAGFITALKTNNGAGQTLGYYEHIFGDYKRMFTAIDRYRAVTAADCRRVAQQVFDAKHRTAAILVPLEVGKEAQP